MLENITIKQVFDDKGGFQYLELWQGSNHIDISLASSDIDVAHHSFKWQVLQKIIEKFIVENPKSPEAIKKRILENIELK